MRRAKLLPSIAGMLMLVAMATRVPAEDAVKCEPPPVDSKLLEIPTTALTKNPLSENLKTICESDSVKKATGTADGATSTTEVSPTVKLPATVLSALNGVCAKISDSTLTLEDGDLAWLRRIRDDGADRWAARFTPPGGGHDGESALVAGSGASGIEGQLVEGLTNFIITRAQAEAALFLRDQLREELCLKNEGLTFFPNLCVAFADADATTSLQAMGSLLKTAAESDLPNLPEAIAFRIACEDAKSCQPTLKVQEAHAILRIGMAFARAVEAGRDPAEVARGISELEPFKCESWKTSPCESPKFFRLASFIYRSAASLAVEKPSRFDTVATLLLLDQFMSNAKMGQLTAAQLDEFPDAAKQALALDAAAGAMKKQLDAIDKPPPGKTVDAATAAAQKVRIIGNFSVRAIRTSSTLAKLFSGKLSSGTAKDIEAATLVIDDTVQLAAVIIERDRPRIALRALSLVANSTALNPKEKYKIPAPVQRFVPLVVELANAESSQGVSAALEAAAAPVGSYRQKYDRRMISIGALFGGTGGWERIESSKGSKSGGAVGIFAPIGVHLTKPFNMHDIPCLKMPDIPLHGGAFLSVVDVGNLASFQLNKGASDEASPKYGFKQIVSPGLYGTLGINKWPVVVGVGASFADGVRQVDGKDARSVRIGAFLALDLTLFPF